MLATSVVEPTLNNSTVIDNKRPAQSLAVFPSIVDITGKTDNQSIYKKRYTAKNGVSIIVKVVLAYQRTNFANSRSVFAFAAIAGSS